jgi:3-dehydroquinate synthase
MSEFTTVPMALGDRSYDIRIGSGLLGAAGAHLGPLLRAAPAIVVTDETVARHHLATLEAALRAAAIDHRTIAVAAGEESKSFAGLADLVDRILALRPERRSTLIALGGGVIGDLAGFAAAIVLRGIDFIQIPTTLLAQVDSSVGGKTGINTRHGKNLVGSFHQPRLVLADTDLLATLAPRELRAGYAEVVKYALIDDAPLFAWLEREGARVLACDSAALGHAVVASCRAKARIVADDERETGARALLNLGHTFGHALEAESGFGPALNHGEAVAAGLALAFQLSVARGLCPAADLARLRTHLTAVGLPASLAEAGDGRWDAAALWARMMQDKKVKGGRVRLILARGIGRAFIDEVIEEAEMLRLLDGTVAV